MNNGNNFLLKSLFFSLLVLFSFTNSFEAQAQNQIGGHFGVVQPIVTFQDGDTNDHFDPHTIGFPMGITVRKNEKFAFDLEFVPLITSSPTNDAINLLIHPGLLWGIGDKLTFGARAAYELGGAGRYGFAPLLNKGFLVGELPVFAEFVLPVRMGSDAGLSVTTAIHFGVGF